MTRSVYHHPVMTDPYQPSPQPQQNRRAAELYGVHGIVIGTLIGSLAAAVVMLYLNYQALGKIALARTIALWGAAFCVLLILLTTLLPNTPVTSVVMIGLQGGLAYFVTERLQGGAIDYHRRHAGRIHSSLRAAGVGALTGLAILVALLTMGTLWGIVAGVPATAPATTPSLPAS